MGLLKSIWCGCVMSWAFGGCTGAQRSPLGDTGGCMHVWESVCACVCLSVCVCERERDDQSQEHRYQSLMLHVIKHYRATPCDTYQPNIYSA